LYQFPKNFTVAIDIVYLWVNGSDGAWRAKRQKYTQKLQASGNLGVAKFGNVEGRYRDNDELRFSLRALEKFFPGHGHVYIVTDGQVPDWFRASDQITLIDHHQLIPESALPVFDSGNIESYIHRISGLSERYFYFNDDVFFGAPVCLENWFFGDGIYVSWSDEPEVQGDKYKLNQHRLKMPVACPNSGFKRNQIMRTWSPIRWSARWTGSTSIRRGLFHILPGLC
jgi:hypothetical protein